MDKLPTEVVEKIFSFSPGKSLKLCRLVCCKWNTLARRYLFRNITIAGREQGLRYLKFFKEFGAGEYVENLILTKKSGVSKKKNSLSLPFLFKLADDMYSLCHNILQIQIVDVNAYYLLKDLGRENLTKLERIDINWNTCPKSPATMREYFHANLMHQSSIKYIRLPSMDLYEQFQANFPNVVVVSKEDEDLLSRINRFTI